MNISEISKIYNVRKLFEEDSEICYSLMIENPLYFHHCPPVPTLDTPKEDMLALPPNKSYDDKYYIGFFDDKELVAIADIILEYPSKDTIFIGFFMVNLKYQGKNIGSEIIKEIELFFKKNGYHYIRLGYVKTNNQSKCFWEKNNYISTGLVVNNEEYDVIVMEKDLRTCFNA